MAAPLCCGRAHSFSLAAAELELSRRRAKLLMPTRKTDVGTAKAKDEWVPDREASDCAKCESRFTLRRRKHHCRLCGEIFCSACSEARATRGFNGVVFAKPQRACMDCYAKLRRKPLSDGGAAQAPGMEPEPELAALEPEPQPQPQPPPQPEPVRRKPPESTRPAAPGGRGASTDRATVIGGAE